MFVVVTMKSMASMRPSAFAPIRPSESEIAAPISSTVMIAEAWVANSAKIHDHRPEAVDRAGQACGR